MSGHFKGFGGAVTNGFGTSGRRSRYTIAGSTVQSRHSADQPSAPIVGLWAITLSYGPSLGCPTASCVLAHVISGWTSDGLEFDQDISPILTGAVCYGAVDQTIWQHLRPHPSFL